MADDMRRRREATAAAFIARRAELGLTQQEVADRGGLVVRTVQYFESGRWPNPVTRARIEKAVGWAPGEIARLAGPPRPFIDPQLLDRVAQLGDDEREWLISWLSAARDRGQSAETRRRGG